MTGWVRPDLPQSGERPRPTAAPPTLEEFRRRNPGCVVGRGSLDASAVVGGVVALVGPPFLLLLAVAVAPVVRQASWLEVAWLGVEYLMPLFVPGFFVCAVAGRVFAKDVAESRRHVFAVGSEDVLFLAPGVAGAVRPIASFHLEAHGEPRRLVLARLGRAAKERLFAAVKARGGGPLDLFPVPSAREARRAFRGSNPDSLLRRGRPKEGLMGGLGLGLLVFTVVGLRWAHGAAASPKPIAALAVLGLLFGLGAAACLAVFVEDAALRLRSVYVLGTDDVLFVDAKGDHGTYRSEDLLRQLESRELAPLVQRVLAHHGTYASSTLRELLEQRARAAGAPELGAELERRRPQR